MLEVGRHVDLGQELLDTDHRGQLRFHELKRHFVLVLKVIGLPTSVLFDRDGRELGRLTGIAEWDSDEAAALIKYYRDRD